MARFFIWPLGLFLFLASLTSAFHLKKTDVKATMDEMLAYHVEYKQFSSLLARRSLKVYLQQFDFEKTYLLENEAKLFLNPKEEWIVRLVSNYPQNDLSGYMALNQVIQRAIARARNYRLQIQQELTQKDTLPEAKEGVYFEYARNEEELKARIRNQILQILNAEKRNGSIRSWTKEGIKKLFILWEKRFSRLENPYLGEEHYLCMHVLKAMAKSLDAHSSYFSPEEAYDMRTSLEKQFKGIGVVLREGVDGVIIYDMIKGGRQNVAAKFLAGIFS